MSSVKLGKTVRYVFHTSSPTTGNLTDADSTPVVTVREQGVDLVYSPTVTRITTGTYEVAIVATTGNGFDTDKEYTARGAASVGGIAGGIDICAFTVDATAIEVFTAALGTYDAVGTMGHVFNQVVEGLIRAIPYTPNKPFVFAADLGSDTGQLVGATWDIEILSSAGAYTALAVTTDYTLATDGASVAIVSLVHGVPAGTVMIYVLAAPLTDGTGRYAEFALQESGSGISGTAVTGTLTTTSFTTNITATVADQFKDTFVTFVDGANKGQTKRVGASTTGANSVFTLKTGYALTTAPSNGDHFEVVNG